MPLTVVSASIAITQGLSAQGIQGSSTPTIAKAVAVGVQKWVRGLPVKAIDTGSSGSARTSSPLIVPPQILQPALAAGFKSEGLQGTASRSMIVGFAAGLSRALADARVIVDHTMVGSGTSKLSFGPSSAIPSMIDGFQGENLGLQFGRAVGRSLDQVFASFTLVVDITGPSGASPASGSAVGFIL
jgi:hypothetical protein